MALPHTNAAADPTSAPMSDALTTAPLWKDVRLYLVKVSATEIALSECFRKAQANSRLAIDLDKTRSEQPSTINMIQIKQLPLVINTL